MAALPELAEPPTRAPSPGEICVIANARSGTNARDAEAIERAFRVFGDAAVLREWTPGEDLRETVQEAIDAGARTVVAAGGDGTAMAAAQALLGTDVALAVLPLGTFNYFARGLGLPEDPEEAARAILAGRRHQISVGMVGEQVFLNNASLGVYPAILKERETVYKRWGRRRLMAHWSVLKTFLRFQRPMKMRITADGVSRNVRAPLLFVARSSYQLDRFGLAGTEAIKDDRFAVLIGRATSRGKLFKITWRLVTGTMQEGRDYDMIAARHLTVETAKPRTLVAFDGEKSRERSPFTVRIADRPLTIIRPDRS
ncbi:diacylglycerol/lipid kinase family protein [Vannielia litorea]|uniref:Diacylglycerol kinase family enzyme n=1 Tax=Vannielia litorea TaxID=1217970 RepID=A0A1N6H6Y8_9RHOB|nr:diacylglycerol kinase family protein [Vannielia litorea]SIO15571.1 Diacylglycerol kinase family enzyme [Vannielia litorea]